MRLLESKKINPWSWGLKCLDSSASFPILIPNKTNKIQLRPTVENGSKNSILIKEIYEDGRGGGRNICPLPLIIESRKKSSSLGYWDPQIFIGDPRYLYICIFVYCIPQYFRWRTPYYHLRPQNFYWRPPIFIGEPYDFHWRPHFFIGDPIFSLENPRFSLETLKLTYHWRPQDFHLRPYKSCLCFKAETAANDLNNSEKLAFEPSVQLITDLELRI